MDFNEKTLISMENETLMVNKCPAKVCNICVAILLNKHRCMNYLKLSIAVRACVLIVQLFMTIHLATNVSQRIVGTAITNVSIRTARSAVVVEINV